MTDESGTSSEVLQSSRWEQRAGPLLAGSNASEHFCVYGVLFRQCCRALFQRIWFRAYLRSWIFVSIPVLFMCLYVCIFIRVCIYIYISCAHCFGWLLFRFSAQKNQQFHNSLLTFTDLSSLLNHNCSLCFVRSGDKNHCLITVPHNSEYWSRTLH